MMVEGGPGGGTVSSSHRPPQSSLRQENVTVFGCLTHEVPLSLGDAAVTCSKGEDEDGGEERRLAVPRGGGRQGVAEGTEEGWAGGPGKWGGRRPVRILYVVTPPLTFLS